YETQEITVTTTGVEISLVQGQTHLTEVVVVGYGTQRRSDLTGSVASVSKSLLTQQTPSFDNLLQGSVPGVAVTQSSGQPGATSTIRIRGGNSISFGNDPLYVIDGFIIYNNNGYVNTGAANGPGINALSTINPSDIESIDILKDASATAIYGSNGANGVVIITTKRGRKGSTEVSYSNYLGAQTVAKKLSLLNASQWGALVNDINISDGKPITYSDSALAALGTGSDWQSAALRNAFQQNHELSISGGDEKSRFLISGNYYDQDGIILNSGFKRYSGRINYERNLTDKFKISTNIFGSRSTVNAPFGSPYGNTTAGLSGGFSSIVFTSPAAPVKNADGTYNTTNALLSSTNPIQDLVTTINQTNLTRVLANIAGEYKFTRELTLKVTAGVDLLNSKQNYYSPTFAGSPAGSGGTGYSVNGYAAVGSAAATTWLNENTLTYDHAFNDKHFLTVLAGYTTQNQHAESAVASAQKFTNNLTTFNNLSSAGTANLPTSSSRDQVQNSFLARVSYSYLHKYNVTVSERADGASQLGANNRWGYFPSVGLSWNVDKEEFFKHVEKTINSLKVRVTAGQTGNSNIPPYSSLSSLTPTNYYFGSPQTLATGLSPNQLGNPNLKWETTTQYNAGIDVGFFKNRINLTFDAYYKKTTDLLLNVPLPLYTGYATRLQNIGSVENKGIEIGINSQNIVTRKFLWTSAVVFGLNRNKVLSLEPGVTSYFPTAPIGLVSPVIVKVGLPVGAFWGYSTGGLLTQADLDKGVPLLAGVSQKVGDRKYLPLTSGTSTITTADKH
ncbi:MAG TPA: SusC/RagA family TonB-linked outer membrane protein, partial [Mucilaginibacter sp.]